MKKQWILLPLLLLVQVAYSQEDVTTTNDLAANESLTNEVATDENISNEVAFAEAEAITNDIRSLVGYTVTNNNKLFASPNARFEVTGTDALSGLKEIQVSIDGSDYSLFKYPISLTTEGEHTINYKFIDRVENESYAQPFSVTIDAQAPNVLSPNFTPAPYKASGFSYVGPHYELGFKTFDQGVGVAFVDYAIDNSEELMVFDASNTNTLSSLGLTNTKAIQLFYKAVDKVSNVTALSSNTYMLDATAPVVNVFAKVVEIEGVRYISSKTPINIEAFDDETAVKSIFYRVQANNVDADTNEMVTISNEIMTNEAGEVSTNSFTNAVTELSSEDTTVVADETMEDTNEMVVTDDADFAENTNATPEFYAYDQEIGIYLTNAGSYTVYAKAVDMVGNESEEVAYEVAVDMVAPEGQTFFIGEVDSTEYNKIENLNGNGTTEETEEVVVEETAETQEVQEVVIEEEEIAVEETVTETDSDPTTEADLGEVPAGTELN